MKICRKAVENRFLQKAIVTLMAVFLFYGSPVCAEVTVHFVLDGSGSMWGQMYDQYKIVTLKDGVEKFLESAPQGIQFGVRVFGLPGGEGCSNTQLLVKPGLNVEQEAVRAIKRMNPTGQAPIIFSLRKGLKELEGIPGKKVLILVADGGDSCEKDPAEATEKLSLSISGEEIHVIGLGIKDEEERAPLKLLAAKANGSYNNVANSTQLTQGIQRIVTRAIQEEERRLRLLAEEEARMASLAEKTRLVVEFVSDVPRFFCTGIRLLELKIDETSIGAVVDQNVACSGRVPVYDQPVPHGTHTVSLSYHKDNHEDVVRSRPESFSVQVEPGKTTRLQCRTSGHLFYWGLDSEIEIESSP